MQAKLTLTLLIGASTLIIGCATPQTQRVSVNSAAVKTEEYKQMEIVAEETMAETARLANVSWAVQTKGRAMCRDDLGPLLGMQAISKPDDKVMAKIYADKFNIKDRPTVFHVVPGSSADLAGVRAGDELLKINDKRVEKGKSISSLLTNWKEGQQTEITVQRQGNTLFLTATPAAACKYPISMTQDTLVNAYADGNMVYITRGAIFAHPPIWSNKLTD